MADWNTTISTTHLDAASDDPSQARADLKIMADQVNFITDSRGDTSGLCALDANGYVANSNLRVGSGCYSYQQGSQSLTTGTWTPINFNAESFDDANFHSLAASSRITIPANVSRIKLTAQVAFAIDGTGERQACFAKNGSRNLIGPHDIILDASASYQGLLHLVGVYPCAQSDYFEVHAWQNTGAGLSTYYNISNLTLGSWFACEVLRM